MNSASSRKTFRSAKKKLECVCVCVNPCFEGSFQADNRRGTELSDATLSNEAMHQRGKHPLAMDVYLLQRLNRLSN